MCESCDARFESSSPAAFAELTTELTTIVTFWFVRPSFMHSRIWRMGDRLFMAAIFKKKKKKKKKTEKVKHWRSESNAIGHWKSRAKRKRDRKCQRKIYTEILFWKSNEWQYAPAKSGTVTVKKEKKEKRGKRDKWGVRNLEEFGIGNSWWMRGIRMCLLAGLLLAQKTAVYNTSTIAKNTCEWPAIRFVSTTPGWRSSRRKRRIDPPVRLYSPSFFFSLFFIQAIRKKKEKEEKQF